MTSSGANYRPDQQSPALWCEFAWPFAAAVVLLLDFRSLTSVLSSAGTLRRASAMIVQAKSLLQAGQCRERVP
jgi:hypothetical protein